MFLLFFVIWIMLNGRITLEIFLFGVAICAAVYLFSVKMFGYGIKKDLRLLKKVPMGISYFFYLLYEVIKSALSVFATVLSPKSQISPVVVEFRSGLKSSFANTILANSITLTPGTITMVQIDDYFIVHCLKREYSEGLDTSNFVKMLKELEK